MSRVSFVNASDESAGCARFNVVVDLEPSFALDELSNGELNELFLNEVNERPIDELNESSVYFAKRAIEEPNDLSSDEVAKGPIVEPNELSDDELNEMLTELNELNKDKKKRKREELEKDKKKREREELKNCHDLANCTMGMQSCCCALKVLEAISKNLPPNEYKSWKERLDPSKRDALFMKLSSESSIKDVEFLKSYLGDELNSSKANHQYRQQQRGEGRGRVGKAIVYYLLALVICEYEDQCLDHDGAYDEEWFAFILDVEVDDETFERLRWVYRILSYMKRLLPIEGNSVTYELVACVASGTGKFHQRSGKPDRQAIMLNRFLMIIDKLKGRGDKMEGVCHSLSDDNAEPSSKRQRI